MPAAASSRSRILAVSSAAIALAGLLTLSSTAGAQGASVGPGELSTSLTYSCSFNVDGLEIGTRPVEVTALADFPETAGPGDVLPSRDLQVTLQPSELVRDVVVALFAATAFEGQSGDAGLSMMTAGQVNDLDASRLVASSAPVPQEIGQPWIIPATMSLAPITVPPGATGALWLGMPTDFTMTGELARDLEPASMTMVCTTADDRTLGGIALAGSSDPTPPTWPQPDPTTTPTDPPTTSTPTTPPVDPTAPVQVGPGLLSRTLVHQCEVAVSGLSFGTYPVSVTAAADYPETADPGDVLASRDLDMSLGAPELLRQALYGVFRARTFEGVAEDAALWIESSGRTTDLAPGSLSVPHVPIPSAQGEPWTMAVDAVVPTITVPADATGAVWLGLPQHFTITGTLEAEIGGELAMTMACTGPADRLIGGIALAGAIDPTPPTPSSEPTGPTDPPTTPVPTTVPPTSPPTGPVPIGPGELSRTLYYVCEISTAGGQLPIGAHVVPVTASVDYPEVATGGDTLPGRALDVDLDLEQGLQRIASQLLAADEFSASADLALSTTTAGHTTQLPSAAFDVARAEVPLIQEGPWTLHATGTIPEVVVPEDAAEALWLGMPGEFVLSGTLFPETSTGPTYDWLMSCTAPSDRLLAGIALEGWDDPTPPTSEPTESPTTIVTDLPTSDPTTDPTTDPTVEPTTDPTTEPSVDPTTEPTIEPTTEPTTGPTSEPTVDPVLLDPTVKVGALGLWRSAVFTVGVSAPRVLPTGSVVVRLGDRTVGRGRLFLGGAVVVAGDLPRGKHTFTITYSGDSKVAPRTVTKAVRIL